MRDERPRLVDGLRIAHRTLLKKNHFTAEDAEVSQRTRRRWRGSGAVAYLRASFAPSAVKRSFSYRSSGTIQNGFEPRATRWQLSNALRQRFGWLSQVGPAECGLKIAFFSVNSS